jgi:hypothetical protein
MNAIILITTNSIDQHIAVVVNGQRREERFPLTGEGLRAAQKLIDQAEVEEGRIA